MHKKSCINGDEMCLCICHCYQVIRIYRKILCGKRCLFLCILSPIHQQQNKAQPQMKNSQYQSYLIRFTVTFVYEIRFILTTNWEVHSAFCPQNVKHNRHFSAWHESFVLFSVHFTCRSTFALNPAPWQNNYWLNNTNNDIYCNLTVTRNITPLYTES